MSPVQSRTALQHVGLGLLLVGIVALVTVCFNLVGTISSSILVGLLLGTSRQWKWHILLISLLFPAAMLGLVEFSNGDMLPRTKILLPMVCWIGFMVTYLLGYAVVYFERHGQNASEPTANHPVASNASGSEIPAATELVPVKAPDCLTLDMLQGEWSCESSPLKGEKTILQVAGDEVHLCVVNPDGRVLCLAKGHLQLQKAGGDIAQPIPTPLQPSSPKSMRDPSDQYRWIA